MPVVKIVDIDGEQWDIEDQDARDKITVLEDSLSTKDAPDAQITLRKNYTCKSVQIANCYKVGKINFATIRIINLSGNGVGTTKTINIASTNLIPKKYTTFIARDYKAQTTVRFYLDIDGSICLGESNGIEDGNNELTGEIIFAEP